jgi:glyceraldehyde-3-phosphate dehydrogenase (NADP+)
MKMYLGGKWVDRSEKMKVIDCYDQSLVDTVPLASIDDMDQAITTAARAFEVSKRLPAHQRMSILKKAAGLMQERHEEFARTIAREGIKTIREARKEVTRAIDTMTISGEAARHIDGETISFSQLPSGDDRFGYYVRVPIGVIGAITPFNDPLNLVVHKIGPAIAAGNTVIVKPHSETPLSSLLLAEVLEQAGLPQGILQVITGRGSVVGSKLVSDPRVRMISFTGGVEAGMQIMRNLGLKKVAMELGSNCPNIVMPDADLKLALDSVVSGAFWAAGQNCLHVQRLLLHDDIYDDFSAQFVDAARAYKLGSKLDESTDMGQIITEAEAVRIENWVNESVQKDARLLTGGTRTNITHYPPTVLENLPEDCQMAKGEIYGPVTALYRFKTLDEAVQISNDVDFGLMAAIFTSDVKTAHRAAVELDFGGVMVNESTDYRIDAMPFGGTKNSGLGKEGIQFALAEMTDPKLVCYNLA